MNESMSRRLLGGLRLAVGVASLAAPKAAAIAFGIEKTSSRWVTRLFGSRELALAAALLTARDDQLSAVARIGVIIDSADLASSVVEFSRGRISPYTLISGGGGAALFAALGVDAARRSGPAQLPRNANSSALTSSA